MGPRHGTCGSKDLRYFPEIPYSYMSCLVQCDLNFAIEICGCVPVRWAYLCPANSTGKHHFSQKVIWKGLSKFKYFIGMLSRDNPHNKYLSIVLC